MPADPLEMLRSVPLKNKLNQIKTDMRRTVKKNAAHVELFDAVLILTLLLSSCSGDHVIFSPSNTAQPNAGN